MSTTEQLGSGKRQRSFLESIPDPTANWGRSQYLLWMFVGLMLGAALLAQSTTFEYDFSKIYDRLTVPECEPGAEGCTS
ncbi:MAG: hypothetical protein R2733_03800 [Acidimicrobiales bacterium]